MQEFAVSCQNARPWVPRPVSEFILHFVNLSQKCLRNSVCHLQTVWPHMVSIPVERSAYVALLQSREAGIRSHETLCSSAMAYGVWYSAVWPGTTCATSFLSSPSASLPAALPRSSPTVESTQLILLNMNIQMHIL